MVVAELLVLAFAGVILLVIPGYSITLVLFKDDELDFIERVTLSLGFSLLAIPFLTLMLNQTLRMKINPINVSLIILVMLVVSMYLRSRAGQSKKQNLGG